MPLVRRHCHGQPSQAVGARHVRLTSETLPERAGHHFIDLARGCLMNGDRTAALGSLLTVRKIAAQQTRSPDGP
jgi:hypothetical protein